jgi:hypothetical protein
VFGGLLGLVWVMGGFMEMEMEVKMSLGDSSYVLCG